MQKKLRREYSQHGRHQTGPFSRTFKSKHRLGIQMEWKGRKQNADVNSHKSVLMEGIHMFRNGECESRIPGFRMTYLQSTKQVMELGDAMENMLQGNRRRALLYYLTLLFALL